jgi:spore cortex biosynthesis protein YabQ
MIFSDVANQGAVFAAGLFCGMVCGIYYDILFAVRILTRAGKILTAVLDLIFCLFSSFTFFWVLYSTNGFDIRWYVFVALACGFILERYSFKKPVAIITEKLYNILYNIRIKIKKLLAELFKKKADKEGV